MGIYWRLILSRNLILLDMYFKRIYLVVVKRIEWKRIRVNIKRLVRKFGGVRGNGVLECFVRCKRKRSGCFGEIY